MIQGKRVLQGGLAGAVCLVALLSALKLRAQNELKVTYGNNGLQTLTYKGVTLEDLAVSPVDGFHIWHMKMTDLKGNQISSGEYGWGENNDSRRWDVTTETWTYNFVWGSIQVAFQQTGNVLNMNVTETNNSNSGVVLDGAAIYPFVLHMPRLPVGFNDAGYAQLAFNTTGPSVTLADFSAGEVAAVVPDAGRPLYSGFLPAGGPGAGYTPLISGTAPDNLASFQPHNDRPVMPGQTDRFTVSLRFAASGTVAGTLAADAYASWAATWPPQVNWADRRIIGTAYLASSPQGDPTKPAGYPNNPRRYFNDANAADFDVTNAAGLVKFQARVLQQAQNTVVNLQRLNAQGVITWDLEGEQYPQVTSYVCAPDQMAQVAPEMESVVGVAGSPYVGMKLDDAYFKTMRDAGFRVGVCIRPQHFTVASDGTAQQVYLPDAQVVAEITRKMKYAHDRWGATLFYIDSSVESNGAVLDAGLFQQAAAVLPDSLLIPEETTSKHYAYTAPFETFIFHGDLGTDLSVYNYYPKAFSANLINDVDAGTLAAHQAQLTASVKRGDVLMVHADYWQANNPTVVQIYADAGVIAPAPTPTPVPAPPPPSPAPPTPAPAPPSPPAPVSSGVTITTPAVGSTLSGAIQVAGAVNVQLDAAGSYLMVDGTEIGTRRVSAPPFVYPLDTGTLANGSHSLQLWAHDVNNVTSLSPTVTVMVANGGVALPIPAPLPAPAPAPSPVPTPRGPVAIGSPLAGETVAGMIQVLGQVNVQLDAAGSYLMVDGVEVGTRRITGAPFVYALDTATLTNGQHLLQLWAHDTGNNTDVSAGVAVTVAN